MQSCVFSPVAKIAYLCVYMVRYSPHMGNTGTSSLHIWVLVFFWKAVQVILSLLALCLPLVAMLPTAEKVLAAVLCQVLYIALCLYVCKAPTICVSTGHHTLLVKCLSHETLPFSRLTSQHPPHPASKKWLVDGLLGTS